MGDKMDNKKVVYKKSYVSYSDYVEGNTVRKRNALEVPQKEQRTYVDNQRVSTSRDTYRNREKALRMSASYVIILAVCSILMVGMCYKYLSLRNDISDKTASVAAMKVNIESLKAQNDSLDYTINSYMDIANISKIATEELGMVQAGQNQIRFYNSTDSEYMKQFFDIPKN